MTGMQRCRQPVGETPLQRKFGFLISICAQSARRRMTPAELSRSPKVKSVWENSPNNYSSFYTISLSHFSEMCMPKHPFLSQKGIYISVKLEVTHSQVFAPPTLRLPPWPFSTHMKMRQNIGFGGKDVGGCKQKANYAVV